ncbi:MAG: aldo/keto reductase [Coriobacteriia bacterium]|nr:aldo/keto reductase [Coriobacteriia bacterium]
MAEYLGEDIAKLGFGLMRLPRIDKAIDIKQLEQMVDLFLDAGFTYFDTAYGYSDSEAAIGEALVKRHPRSSYQLATKLPAWTVKTKVEAERLFWTSLERTGLDYFDFYLLHNVSGPRMPFFDEYRIWDFLAERREEGLIRHLGFSFHDKPAVLDKLLFDHPEIEFVQLQINYVDWDDPAMEAAKCYEIARSYGKPVVVMEPVRGGNLMKLPPAAVEAFKTLDPKASLASWALRYVASLEGIITVLSGMSDLAQMKDNIATMLDPKPLDQRELAAIESAKKELAELDAIPCTRCDYCMPVCEQKVAIPGIFEAMNLRSVYGEERGAQFTYGWHTRGNNMNPASACIACGNCEAVCTQGILITDELRRARELFEPAAS